MEDKMARKARENDNPLRRARAAHNNMTIKEMAERTGFDPSYLSAIENDRRSASRQVVEQYEKVLKLKPGALSSARDAASNLIRKAIDGIGTLSVAEGNTDIQSIVEVPSE